MATPEEQLAQLADRVNQLGQLLQQSQERNALLEGRMQGLEAAGAQMGPAIQALATAQTEVANAMKKDEKKINLVDNRGIGKPDKFSGKERELPQMENQDRVIHVFSVPGDGASTELV